MKRNAILGFLSLASLIMLFAAFASAASPEAPAAPLSLKPAGKLGPIPGDLFHVQGISVATDSIYITSVDQKAGKGYLWKIDRATMKTAAKKEISELMMYHPSGLQATGGSIYLAIAVYTEKSNSKVLVIDEKTLKVKKSFRVPDHIGWIASDGGGIIHGGNWDSEIFYSWDEKGKQLSSRPNPTTHGYQDCKLRGRILACSGGGYVDFINIDTWSVEKTYQPTAMSLKGNRMTREGLDYQDGSFYFMPDDGAGSFIYKFTSKK